MSLEEVVAPIALFNEVLSVEEEPRSVAEIRRGLKVRHSQMRNEGANPIEALFHLVEEVEQRCESADDDGLGGYFADAFQHFISDDLRSAFGQYLTPPVVASHVAELLRSHLSQEAPAILDPFGGSGILLDAAAQTHPEATLAAIEINRPVAKVCSALASVRHHRLSVRIGDAFAMWVDNEIETVDAVVMNPPFGASLATVDKERITAKSKTGSLKTLNSPPVELVALELASSVLRDSGVLVAVLPAGVLTNNRYGAFRADFFSRNALLHVTLLPESTFAPYRGVASACVIVCRKGAASYPQRTTVRRCESVGYDDVGRPYGKNDLDRPPVVIKQFTMTEEGTWASSDEPTEGEPFFVLGDVADVFRGTNPKLTEYRDDGPFLLKVGSLSGSFVSWKSRDRTYVSEEWFRKQSVRHLLKGDICLTSSAHRPRYIALKVDLLDTLPLQGATPSGEVMVIRVKENAPVTSHQLLYYLRSNEGRSLLQSQVRGSTAHLYPSDVAHLRIPLSEMPQDADAVAAAFGEAAEAFRNYQQLEEHALRTAWSE